jgi:hypothetical protein
MISIKLLLMLSSIIPLKTLFLQSLFVLIQIAIESSFLYHFLNISRKASLEYSIPMNLFSTIMGWLFFLFFVPLAEPNFQIQVMNFILFNKLSEQADFLIIIMIFTVFTLDLILKLLMFMFLEKLQKAFSVVAVIPQEKGKIFSQKLQNNKKYRFIIWGHSCSHVLILLVLTLVNFNSR